jgi:hypothetical protein
MTYIAYNSSKAHNNNGVIVKGEFREYTTFNRAEKFGATRGLYTVRDISQLRAMSNGDLMLVEFYDSAMAEMANEATQMTDQFITYGKYSSTCSYAVIKYNSYTKATIDILAKYNSEDYARLYAEKNNAIVVRIADLVVVDKGYNVYSNGNVLMEDKAIALNAQFAKQWELRQGELSDSVNRHFATNKVANDMIIGGSMNTFSVVEDLIEYYAELPIVIDESLLTIQRSAASYSNRAAVNHESGTCSTYEVDWDKGEAIVPDSQNEAKLTNLQASQMELASSLDTDTDTVVVAIEVANFITNYFGYTRPVILVRDNVATLRYVDTLQTRFSITVAISSGGSACLSGMDISSPHEREIIDYLLNRFTSNTVKSITLAKLKPRVTNLAMPTGKLSNDCPNRNEVVGSWQSNCPHCGLSTLGKFWDNVEIIPFDDRAVINQ